jgi:hypothetical protein
LLILKINLKNKKYYFNKFKKIYFKNNLDISQSKQARNVFSPTWSPDFHTAFRPSSHRFHWTNAFCVINFSRKISIPMDIGVEFCPIQRRNTNRQLYKLSSTAIATRPPICSNDRRGDRESQQCCVGTWYWTHISKLFLVLWHQIFFFFFCCFCITLWILGNSYKNLEL